MMVREVWHSGRSRMQDASYISLAQGGTGSRVNQNEAR